MRIKASLSYANTHFLHFSTKTFNAFTLKQLKNKPLVYMCIYVGTYIQTNGTRLTARNSINIKSLIIKLSRTNKLCTLTPHTEKLKLSWEWKLKWITYTKYTLKKGPLIFTSLRCNINIFLTVMGVNEWVSIISLVSRVNQPVLRFHWIKLSLFLWAYDDLSFADILQEKNSFLNSQWDSIMRIFSSEEERERNLSIVIMNMQTQTHQGTAKYPS